METVAQKEQAALTLENVRATFTCVHQQIGKYMKIVFCFLKNGNTILIAEGEEKIEPNKEIKNGKYVEVGSWNDNPVYAHV